MNFTWSVRKAINNLKKHGISFEEAASVFYDPLSITFHDSDHSYDECRYIIIGLSKNNRLVIVAHTDNGDTLRIISARTLDKSERYLYENKTEH